MQTQSVRVNSHDGPIRRSPPAVEPLESLLTANSAKVRKKLARNRQEIGKKLVRNWLNPQNESPVVCASSFNPNGG
eukprot:1176041-Prorocentrum_minimum.AAC.1